MCLIFKSLRSSSDKVIRVLYQCFLACWAVLSHSVMSDSSATPWTAAHQVPLSMEFSQQEYWSGLPWPPPGDLPDPGIEPRSSTLQADFFTIWATRKPLFSITEYFSSYQCIFIFINIYSNIMWYLLFLYVNNVFWSRKSKKTMIGFSQPGVIFFKSKYVFYIVFKPYKWLPAFFQSPECMESELILCLYLCEEIIQNYQNKWQKKYITALWIRWW